MVIGSWEGGMESVRVTHMFLADAVGWVVVSLPRWGRPGYDLS